MGRASLMFRPRTRLPPMRMRRISPSRFFGKGKRRLSPQSGFRKRQRTGRSQTKTRRVKTKVYNGHGLTGQQTFMKHFMPGYKFNTKTTKLGGALTFLQNEASNYSWNIGQQKYLDFTACITDDLQGLLQVWKNTMEHSVYNGTTNLGIQTNDRVFVTFADFECWMTNSSDIPTFIELYDYVCQRDNENQPSEILNPDQQAFGPSGGFTSYSLASSTVGVQPTDSNQLSVFYKIKKRTRIWLAPGETHIHKIRASFNKVYNNEIAGNNVYVKGWTFGVMARCVCSVIGGATNGRDVGGGQISTYETTRIYGRGVFTSEPGMGGQYAITAVSGAEQFVNEEIGQVFKSGTGITTDSRLNP